MSMSVLPLRLLRLAALGLAFVTLPACGDPTPKAGSDPAATQAPATPAKPLVQKTQVADWCGEHGVPESECTRCNAQLIAGFKAKGDWCEKHALPDSQCLVCHPEREAELKAKAPK